MVMMVMVLVMVTMECVQNLKTTRGAYHRHGDKYVIKLLAGILGVCGKWG